MRAAAIALALILGACYPGEISNVAETDVVLTLHKDVDYAQFATYAMPDTVIDICQDIDQIECDDPIDIDHDYDEEILLQVEGRLSSYGYTRIPLDEIDESNQPSLVVLVTVFAVEQSATTCYPWWGWWGWWPGWGYYPPGWGGGYCSTSTWDKGTLAIDMIDPDEFDPDQDRVGAIWTANMSGVLSRSSSGGTDRIDRAIQQAFDQSTYLNRTGN
jgi:hypothetical protein